MYVLVLRNREPLSYGEESVGVKTLIKKISILLPERGEVVQVPAILGNGLRGVLRDIMTYVFLEKVAEKAKAKNKNVEVDARVLLLMLTGGILKRRGEEQITARSIENLRKKVELLPPLSSMGFALSNVMIPSKIKVSVFYPVSKETFDLVKDLIERVKSNLSTVNFDELKEISVKDLVGEVQMMHKDDVSKLTSLRLENIDISNIDSADSIRGRSQGESTQESEETSGERTRARLQAIFQREYVLPGTVFVGYISEVVPLTDVERELLALSIKRLEEDSGVGGAVARGFGSFIIEHNELTKYIKESESKLDEFIEEKLDSILNVLKSDPETWLSQSS
jgi:CRISPR type IV-associated protein Csf2